MSDKLNNAYITTEVENWNDFFLLHQRFISRFVFRGQANADWKLQTSLDRLINKLHPNYIDPIIPASYEDRMIEEFVWKYPLYEKNIIPQKEEYIEWLALMQHYGSPTRLLDFSHSLFVALFMAIDNYSFDYSAVWGLNKIILNHKIFDKYRAEYETNYAGGNDLENYIYNRANTSIKNSMSVNLIEPELYVVKPKNCNERQNRQQGLFVIPSNIQSSFEENLFALVNDKQVLSIPIKNLIEYSNSRSGNYSQSDILLVKINIHKRLNLEITKILKQMNISAETLYPGLEGLAKSMSCLRDAMGDYKY